MADSNRYSWQDAIEHNYSAGNYGNIPGRIMPWSRNTVADGWWLNRETIMQLSGRDEYLLSAVNNIDGTKPIINARVNGEYSWTNTAIPAEVTEITMRSSVGDDDKYSLYVSGKTSDNQAVTGEFYLWKTTIDDLPEAVNETAKVPILRWTQGQSGPFMRMGYRSLDGIFGNYVSAGNNQKLTMVTADSLTLEQMQPGIIYLV